MAQRGGRALIEQNFHVALLCGFEAALSALQHGVDLGPRDARKPFQELLHGGASFNVLKERFHRDTRILEKPGAADFSGNPLYGGAL